MPKPLVIALVALLLAAACSSNDASIATVLDEYEIDLERTSAPAGEVSFSVRNAGEIAHQLIVLRTERPADDLPVKDGVVATDAKRVETVGEIELLSAGGTQDLTLDLDSGRYVLICNIAGHYPSGMRARFSVR
jgi:uncharacterized cupredoxin-like copper-binding protein